jgi:hypothetical protein
MIERARKRLGKSAKKGFRGWPVATVALYGPEDSTATKLTVGIGRPEEFRIVTRAHIIAWRDELAQRGLGGSTFRHRLASLASV